MKRIPSLDGLRAISVLLVLLGHLGNAGYVQGFLAAYADTGVRVFFVISGYLITAILLKEYSLTRSINLRQFYLRRAYRILPAAGAFMTFAFVLYWRDLHWYDMCAALFYVMDFHPARPWMLIHLWSLGVEEQFYFAWPSLLRKFYEQKVTILLSVVALAPLFIAATYFFKLPQLRYAFPAVADTLAIGCLIAIFAERLPKIKIGAAVCMLIAVILIPQFPCSSMLRTILRLFVLSPILHLSIAGIILHVVETPYRILNVAPVVWLGKISYSLYLWQQPFFYHASPRPVAGFICAIALTCLSYYLIERPFLALREKRSAAPASLA